MNTQLQTQIFLADQRGCSGNDLLRSYHTFNFGPYVAEGRIPFGALCLLNDDTLRPGASLSMQTEQPTQVLILPIVGGVEYTVDGVTHFLEPGQTGELSLAAGMVYTVTNPYPTELINCLQIWFTPSDAGPAPTVRQTDFDLATPNTLLPVNVPGLNYTGYIGRFAGREEGTYLTGPVLEGAGKHIFVLVLQGVFEVANRLLHEKDGLALTYQQEDVVEFEALSNDALLLVLTC